MNPILQMLQTNNSIMDNISGLAQMAKGNPQGMFTQMMQTNPKFADFVRQNQGKPVEQIARENGIDISILNQLMK